MEDLLEEIVGNIYDEFDPQEEKDIEKVGDNLWRVAGSCELERVAEATRSIRLDTVYFLTGKEGAAQ